jgi:flagellar hook protein FlgE
MSALYSAVSGMLAHQSRMDSIGNNIANVSTTGYKSERVQFSDTMSHLLRPGIPAHGILGGVNPMQVGTGVQVSSTDTNFGQGDLLATGRATDVALKGDGFLAVTDGTRVYYTRDGALGVDANGSLIHMASGMRVVSQPGEGDVATGSAVTPASTLTIPLGKSLAKATENVALGGNLDSRSAAGAEKTVTAQIYDSLGNSHNVALKFTRNATAGTWNVTATSPDGTVSVGSPAQVTFDANGAPTVQSLSMQMTLTNPNGATSPQPVAVSTSGLSQQAQDSSAALRAQDGLPSGTLTGITFTGDGSVLGVFSNGLTSKLGGLVTATFSNNGGLERTGGNLFTVGANSGEPVYGAAGAEGRGTLVSGELEGSNVNLAEEFADMIVTQRGFQANSRMVTTADQMLQELINTAR